jgi:hypothetical protein
VVLCIVPPTVLVCLLDIDSSGPAVSLISQHRAIVLNDSVMKDCILFPFGMCSPISEHLCRYSHMNISWFGNRESVSNHSCLSPSCRSPPMDTILNPLQPPSYLTNFIPKAAFTLCKLARASQVPEMRAQSFHASYGSFDRLNLEASCDFHSTCVKRLRSHPRHLTRARKFASCKRGSRPRLSPTVLSSMWLF